VEVPGRTFAAGVIVCPSGSFERERAILDAGVRRMRRGRAWQREPYPGCARAPSLPPWPTCAGRGRPTFIRGPPKRDHGWPRRVRS